MWTDRAALLSIVVLTSANLACSPRAGGQPDDAKTQLSADSSAGAASCKALETRAPNAPDSAPGVSGPDPGVWGEIQVAFDVVVLAKGLEHPWAVEPLPRGDLLVTERPGRLRIISGQGRDRPADQRPTEPWTPGARAACSMSR